MTAASQRQTDTLVPLADRLRHLQAFRVAAVITVVATWVGFDDQRGVPLWKMLVAAALYLALSIATGAVWRERGRRNLLLLGFMLLVDGIYLAGSAYLGGGITSPLRYLVVLHLVVVALLASYRTGMKLALWHSLLLFVSFDAQVNGRLHLAAVHVTNHQLREDVIVFFGLIWLVAITTATSSAANERELRRRSYDLAALARLAEHLETAADAAAVGDVLVDSVVRDLGFTRAVLVVRRQDAYELLSHQGGQPVIRRGDGKVDALLESAGAAHGAVLTQALDPKQDAWLSMLLPDARNLVAVPMYSESRLSAVLVTEYGARVTPRIERRVVGMLERFTSHAALAMGNAWLVEALERLASTDSLTGLATRRTFDAALTRELARSQRSGEPVTLALVDIDHFKQVNDEFGHVAGDGVLRTVAAAIADECRGHDLAARFGGEEFAVLLPGVDHETSAEVGERIRRAVAECGTTPPVTVSIGLATFPAAAADAGLLVDTADEALYRSKHEGRDRVSQAPRLHVPPQRGLRVVASG